MTDIDEFYDLVEKETAAAGPEAAADLRYLEDVCRLSLLIGDRRRERGLTQQQLAAASGIRQSEISRVEGAAGNPTVKTLSALATALDLELTFVPRVEDQARRPARQA